MVPTYKGFIPGVLKNEVLNDRLEKAAVNFENGSATLPKYGSEALHT
jgi:hypothetical protein